MTTCDRELCRWEEALAAGVPDKGVAAGAGAKVAVRPRRTPWTYVGRVMIHPYNVLVIGSALLMSFIAWSPLLLLLGLGAELIILCVVPWRGYFRRRIDAQIDDVERAAAAKVREALVRQMDIRHQQELARLDRLVDRTRDNIRRRGGAVPTVLEGTLGVSHLVASYIRLAVAHKAGQESLAMTNYGDLMETIRSLEATRGTAGERMRGLSERRLAIAYRRAECWSRTREGLDIVAQKLATILEMIQLMHEQSTTPADSRATCVEIDRFLRDLEDGEGTLRELDELDMDRFVELEELEAEQAAATIPMRLSTR